MEILDTMDIHDGISYVIVFGSVDEVQWPDISIKYPSIRQLNIGEKNQGEVFNARFPASTNVIYIGITNITKEVDPKYHNVIYTDVILRNAFHMRNLICLKPTQWHYDYLFDTCSPIMLDNMLYMVDYPELGLKAKRINSQYASIAMLRREEQLTPFNHRLMPLNLTKKKLRDMLI